MPCFDARQFLPGRRRSAGSLDGLGPRPQWSASTWEGPQYRPSCSLSCSTIPKTVPNKMIGMDRKKRGNPKRRVKKITSSGRVTMSPASTGESERRLATTAPIGRARNVWRIPASKSSERSPTRSAAATTAPNTRRGLDSPVAGTIALGKDEENTAYPKTRPMKPARAASRTNRGTRAERLASNVHPDLSFNATDVPQVVGGGWRIRLGDPIDREDQVEKLVPKDRGRLAALRYREVRDVADGRESRCIRGRTHREVEGESLVPSGRNRIEGRFRGGSEDPEEPHLPFRPRQPVVPQPAGLVQTRFGRAVPDPTAEGHQIHVQAPGAWILDSGGHADRDGAVRPHPTVGTEACERDREPGDEVDRGLRLDDRSKVRGGQGGEDDDQDDRNADHNPQGLPNDLGRGSRAVEARVVHGSTEEGPAAIVSRAGSETASRGAIRPSKMSTAKWHSAK